ncbi:MAG: putative molybdenum carrier protein [Planctomycetota bacterium]
MNQLPGMATIRPEEVFRPSRIISGGQTGVDRGALDAAVECSIPHGGYCPAGRLAEDGSIPAEYQLWELGSRQYSERTERNLAESDATLIIYINRLSGGTALTRRLCREHDKPVLAVRLSSTVLRSKGFKVDTVHVHQIVHWLSDVKPKTLNVAGPRESNHPGIALITQRLLCQVWQTS